MRSRRAVVIGAVVLAVAVALGVWRWRGRHDEAPSSGASRDATMARQRTGRIRLDLDRYRAQKAEQLRKAKELSQRHATKDRSGSGSARRPLEGFGRMITEGECTLGPGELCDQVREMVEDCEAGDGTTCLAIGQMLADTPPRPLIAIGFFVQACNAGTADGCAQVETTKGTGPIDCERDPFTCAWRGYKANDVVKLDEACGLGVADACAAMLEHTKHEPERNRAYLETACQYGNPMACLALGKRLTPDCRPEPDAPCYPPDADEAKRANEIACSAGWKDACGT